VLVALELTEGTPTERWRVPLEDASISGVTVDGDVAYVGDDGGTVTAVSVADGEVRWSVGLGADGACTASPGRIDTAVAVSQGVVVAVARNVDDGSVVVSAYEAADGSCRWRVGSRLGSTAVSAPAALDGRPVVGLADRSVRTLAGSDGAEVWSELVVSIFLPVSAPALDADHLVVADVGGGVYRLDPDTGERLWSYQLNERVLRSSPVLSGDAVLIGLADGRLVALDGATGHLVWESEAAPGLIGTIALAPDLVVAVKGGRDAGLIAYEHDPEGTLVDEPSPAELDPAVTLARLGIASLITLALTLVPGVLARRRFGDAFADDEEPAPERVGEDA
jgi:outer membrane protein assembly factor BamB